MKCGDKVKEGKFVSDRIKIGIYDIEEYNYILDKLDEVDAKQITTFKIKDYYTFDFSNYNKASVEVVRNYLKEAMSMYFMILAC